MGSPQDTQQNHPGTFKNQIQPEFVSTNDHEYKKICACIRHYSDLIGLLVSDQPLSSADLIANLGASKLKILRDLNRLIKYDLVVKTSFEHHVLYCVNGDFNTIIYQILDL